MERLDAEVFVPLPDEFNDDVEWQQIAEALRSLLELPVELVLPTHGVHTDRAALEHALS